MNESTNIMDQLKKREKPTVPNGFFDLFFDTVMDEIDANAGLLGKLTKSESPTLPADYFSKTLIFVDDLDEAETLLEFTPSKKPVVPHYFFSDFPEKMDLIIGNDTEVEKKSSRIVPIWIIGGVSSIAAMLAIFFVVQHTNSDKSEQPLVQTVETQETEESYDAYLTYLDEDEIIDYIIETGIEIESVNEELNDQSYDDYSVQDIEDYYLETL